MDGMAGLKLQDHYSTCDEATVQKLTVLSSAGKNALKFSDFNVNPLKRMGARRLHFKVFNAIQVWRTFFNFWHSGTLALTAERQSARMSEIKTDRLDLDGQE